MTTTNNDAVSNLVAALVTDRDKVIEVLKAKKVAHSVSNGDIRLADGSSGMVHFSAEGKLVGCSRTVKASLAKHINKAVY